jgi:hypothetical protein
VKNIDTPPLPKGDASGRKITPIVGTPKGSRVEQPFSELMQLKLQRNIDNLKKKLNDSKSWQLTSSKSQGQKRKEGR